MAVGRRARYRLGRKIAGRAGAVLDHERLSGARAQLVGEKARHGVGARARGIADHDAHVALRPRLRLRLGGGEREHCEDPPHGAGVRPAASASTSAVCFGRHTFLRS